MHDCPARRESTNSELCSQFHQSACLSTKSKTMSMCHYPWNRTDQVNKNRPNQQGFHHSHPLHTSCISCSQQSKFCHPLSFPPTRRTQQQLIRDIKSSIVHPAHSKAARHLCPQPGHHPPFRLILLLHPHHLHGTKTATSSSSTLNTEATTR